MPRSHPSIPAVIRLRVTPHMARLLIDLGVIERLSGDTPLDPYRSMLVTAEDLREILGAVPASGHTGLALRRSVKAKLDKLRQEVNPARA